MYEIKKKENLFAEKKKKVTKIDSPAGNRTRVFRVTGGDTYHYTTEDIWFSQLEFAPMYACTSASCSQAFPGSSF